MIKDYKTLASKFSNDFIRIVENGNFTTPQKYDKLKSLFSHCTQLLVELSDEYENLEADFDEVINELTIERENNKLLRECFMNHCEIITEQRKRITELEYYINDTKALSNLVKELTK